MSGRLEFELSVRSQPKAVLERVQDDTMSVLILGDFSARAHRGVLGIGNALAERPAVKVDLDTFEGLLAAIAPRLTLTPAGAATCTIEFRDLEHFHPDSLFERVSVFAEMKSLRARLMDPTTFAAAAAELGRAPSAPTTPTEASPAGADDEGDLLERLLGKRASEPVVARPGETGGFDVTDMIRSLVAPHITPAHDPSRDQYVAIVDDAMGRQMRALLHDPDFRALEAQWRGLDELVTHLELTEELSISIVDVSKEELKEDQRATPTPETSGFAHLLERSATGGRQWSVIVGAFPFSASGDDIGLLAALGYLSASVFAPFLADASPALAGVPRAHGTFTRTDLVDLEGDAAARWASLRSSELASWVGLVHPRLLLRAPYSRASDPIEAFPFDECPDPAGPYLYGPGVYGVARLIGETFLDSGWEGALGRFTYLRDRPTHTLMVDGEQQLLPGAEAQLSESAAEEILRRGLMTYLSHKNHNVVRLARFQSIADPVTSISGAWR